MVQSPSWEANRFTASQKFPAFHGTRRFITALTSVRHLSLSWTSPIQSIYPHPTLWRSILTLSTHLRLGLPSGLFPSGFPTKTLYTPLSSPIRVTCPAHLILLDFITRTILGEEYKSFSSSLCNLLHSPVTSSLLGPNVLKHPQLPFLPQCQRPIFTPIQKYPLCLSYFNETSVLSEVFGEVLKYQIRENPSSGSQVVASGRTDVQTYMTKLLVGFHNFTNAPKIYLIHI